MRFIVRPATSGVRSLHIDGQDVVNFHFRPASILSYRNLICLRDTDELSAAMIAASVAPLDTEIIDVTRVTGDYVTLITSQTTSQPVGNFPAELQSVKVTWPVQNRQMCTQSYGG